MDQSKKFVKSKTTKATNFEELQKKKILALKERQKVKESENYQRLEASFKPLEKKHDFQRFFTAKDKLYETRKEREDTRTAILNVKVEFDEMKNRLKSFIQEQVVNSAKIAIPKTQSKAKTVTH